MLNYSRGLILVFYASLFFILYFLSKKKVNPLYILLICSLFISLFWGLRNFDVGNDTVEYIKRYHSRILRFDYLFEIISILLNYVFFGNGTLYLISISMLINTFTALAIYRLFGKSYTSVLIFILTSAFPYYILANVNILRQGLSIAFLLFGISCFSLENNKNIKIGLLFFIFSALSHKTMIFPILIYLTLKKFNISVYLLLIISLLSVFIFSSDFIRNLIIDNSNFFLFGKLLSRIGYLDFNFALKFSFYFINIIIPFALRKKAGIENNVVNNLEQIMLSCILASSFFVISPVYSERYMYCLDFFIVSYLFSISMGLEEPKKNKFRKMIFLYVVTYAFISLFLNSLTETLML